MDEFEEKEKVVIPYKSLSEDALRGVIENFILREGTDYGVREYTYEEKQNLVIKQLDSGLVSVVYDPNTETCTMLKSDEINQ